MDVKFWGVVGSCPGRNIEMSKIGSNTSCISVECADKLIIFDAGSGIIQLSNSLGDLSKYKSIELFITHYHYDHIIGVPFTPFFYNSNIKINIYGPSFEKYNIESAVKGIFVEPYLPMKFSALRADISFMDINENSIIKENDFEITCMNSDHPGGNLVYKITYMGKKFSYITDIGHEDHINDAIVEFVRKSDLIYYDANFTEHEIESRIYEGWGHSTHEKGLKLLKESLSKKIVLGHHAIHREHDELLTLEKKYGDSGVLIAREGTYIIL